MKKILSVVLVLVLMMSVAVMASAEGALDNTGTEVVLPDMGSLPSIDEAFNALSDFLKFEAFAPYISGFHEALSGFYIQLDLWLKAIGPVLNNAIGSLLNSGIFG